MKRFFEFLHKIYFLHLLILIGLQEVKVERDQSTLVLVHVIFRHGDRTPELSEVYPNDPHRNNTYFPYGYGELTLKGKQKAFKLGLKLRELYGNFLGNLYFPGLLEATSSEYPRARMSLQIVLAAMFPPRTEDLISDNLLWQPVHFNYVPFNKDKYIATFVKSKKITHVDSLVKLNCNQRDLMELLTEKTGKKMKSLSDAAAVQDILLIQSQMGLKLPEWANRVYPDKLNALAILYWKSLAKSKALSQSVGYLLRKIARDSSKKSNCALHPHSRKLFLYSGHDVNIAGILGALGCFGDELIAYSSYIAFELHSIKGTYGIKVYYQNNLKSENAKVLRIPHCEGFCEVDDFVRFTNKLTQNERCNNH